MYWADWISTQCARTTSKTGHFGVLHNKSSYTNIYTHVGSAPPSCFGTKKITTLYLLTAPAPAPLLFYLVTCSVDTVANILPPESHPLTQGIGSKGQLASFPECRAAYQIKGNQVCSNMAANIFFPQTPIHPPPPEG